MAIWKAIMVEHTLTLDGLPRYEVSDNGDVRIADEWSDYYGRLLRKHIMWGEPVVWLNNGSGKGVGRIHKVRELMASAFDTTPKRGRRPGSAKASVKAPVEAPKPEPADTVFRYQLPQVRRTEPVHKSAEPVTKPAVQTSKPAVQTSKPAEPKPFQYAAKSAEPSPRPVEKPAETVTKSTYRPAEQVTRRSAPKTEVHHVPVDGVKHEPRLTLDVYGRRPAATEPEVPDVIDRPVDTPNLAGSTEHIDIPKNERVSGANADGVADHAEVPAETVDSKPVCFETVEAVTEAPVEAPHVEETSEEAPVPETAESAEAPAEPPVEKESVDGEPAELHAVEAPVNDAPAEPPVEDVPVNDSPKSDEPPKRRTRSSRAGMPYKRAVRQLDMDGNVIDEYESGVAAAAATGIAQTSISACCRGKLKKTGGFRWEFVEQSASPSV